MISSRNTFDRKFFILGCIITLALVFIVTRLFYLQVHMTDHLLTRSQNNFLRKEDTLSLRGNILDTNGKLLAVNRPVITIVWKGTGNRKLSPMQEDTFSTIESIVEAPMVNKETIKKTERLSGTCELVKDISFQELSKISEYFNTNPNIQIEDRFTRFYPHKSLASHLLGYLGYLDVDLGGKMGLEKMYEEVLKGKQGKKVKVVNSFGKRLKEQEVEQGLAGQDIYTTLDLSLQRIAEWVFPKDHSGAFLIMDPQDGSIKVFLSHPNFDPNIFLQRLDRETWLNLQAPSKPFLNRIFHASYPPGSIFKLVTLVAALEKNCISQDHTFNCKGYTRLGRQVRCHKRDGHGELTAIEAISRSCNVLFYEISKQLDIDVIAHYARKFGLGQTVSPLFQDHKGLVPTRQWKQKVKGERWWLGETLSVSIGQSFLLTTPLQIARLIGSIETGYLITPRIVEQSPQMYEPLNIRYETRQFLKKAMLSVVEEGTARTLNKLEGFSIYAKTSTAQTSMLDKRKMGDKYLEHGWCAANIRYKDHPPLTMVILTENTGNARLSLLVAKSFLKQYRTLLELREKKAQKKRVT